MPLDLRQNRGPIDETDPTYRDLFEDLQGNIVSGHGRNHAVHFFLHFTANRIADVKSWLARFAQTRITSAHSQFEAARAYREEEASAGVFAHFALSANGYRSLGFGEDEIPTGSNPRNREVAYGDPGGYEPQVDPSCLYEDVFRQGMASRQGVLLDPPQGEWEEEYRNVEKPIHAMLLLAADDPAELIAAEQVVLAELASDGDPLAEVIVGERGINLKKRFNAEDPPEGVGVEHFGYVDGRSQPLFIKRHADRETAAGQGSFWDPRAPLSLVLVPDPHGTAGVSFGSFLVYRKLEQNVRDFRTAEKAVANEMGLPTELAGAMAVGRFKDGTPLVLQPGDGARPIANDFNFAGDPGAVTCPFHAHIRKTNPRLESVKLGGDFAQTPEEELGHRIARRGIPYGGPLSDSSNPDDLPTGGVGLLFFCFQADVWEQFEFIQRFWANNQFFLEPGLQGEGQQNYPGQTGIDAVIGQRREGQVDQCIGQPGDRPTNWPRAWGKPTRKIDANFSEFVKLRGGEYLFSPSIGFLKSLG